MEERGRWPQVWFQDLFYWPLDSYWARGGVGGPGGGFGGPGDGFG